MKWLNSTNIYNFLCVYMPVLYIYRSPVPGVDWGTALVVLFMFSFVEGHQKNKGGMSFALIAVLAYSFLCTAINLGIGTINYSSLTSIVTRTGRFLVVMIVMMGFGYSNHFVPEKYLRILRGLTLFVAGYAILQSVVYHISGVKLINVIGNISEDLALSSSLEEYETDYRPPSIFAEPSHASYFMVPYLCYALFCNSISGSEINNNRFREAIFVSLGILFTTSGQGLVVLAACWGIWSLRSVKKFDAVRLIVVACAFVLLLHNFDFEFTINRITTKDTMNAIEARQGGYLLFDKLTDSYKFFGTGFGNYDDNIYYSSFAEILFCTGYIGLSLVLLLFLRPLLKGQVFQKVLAISCVLLMSGGGIYTASYLCLYMPLLLHNKWDTVHLGTKKS